jgi:hypothetical protein
VIRFLLNCTGVALLGLVPSGRAAELPKAAQRFHRIAIASIAMMQIPRGRAFASDLLSADFAAGNNAGQFGKRCWTRSNSGEMPPKKKARPEPTEVFCGHLVAGAKPGRDGGPRRWARAAACRCGG